jgi:hypothetical protein
MPPTDPLDPVGYLPHIDLILQSLRISRERLNSRSKVAIDTRLLRALLQTIARTVLFDPTFYLAHNPDVASAHAAGQIVDLHKHFLESGFLEGRFASPPPVDEAFYTATYKDIGAAIKRGDIASGAEHYMRSGAAEGRMPSEAMRAETERWTALLTE